MPTRKAWRISIVTTALGVLIGRAFLTSPPTPPSATPSRGASDSADAVGRAEAGVVAKFSADPRFVARVAGIPSSQLPSYMMALGTRGLRRLGDTALVAFAGIEGIEIPLYSHAMCEAMANPASANADRSSMASLQSESHAALARLDSTTLARYVALSSQAVEAELDNRPADSVSKDELASDMVLFLAHTPSSERLRIRAFLDRPETISADERCWVMTQLFAHADRLASPHDGHLVRRLLSP